MAVAVSVCACNIILLHNDQCKGLAGQRSITHAVGSVLITLSLLQANGDRCRPADSLKQWYHGLEGHHPSTHRLQLATWLQNIYGSIITGAAEQDEIPTPIMASAGRICDQHPAAIRMNIHIP